MKLSAIESIVHSRLSCVKNPEVKEVGYALLEKWKSSEPGKNFCDKEVYPMLKSLSRKSRAKAFEVLHRVKDDIADTAADETRRFDLQRRSADKMKQELLHGYEVIERMGRGVVYFGSARSKPGDSDYDAGRELGREVSQLLKVTSWSGAGPGAMEGPIIGAKEAGGSIGGIKITLRRDESAFEQEVSPVFKDEEVAQMDFFGPRKVSLIDAAMAENPESRRAVIALPGGFGTLDEFFELVTLKQLHKLGTNGKIPILLMNYGGYYEKLLEFCRHMLQEGKINDRDMKELFSVCATNKEALDCLSEEFSIPEEERTYDERLLPWSAWYPDAAAWKPELTLHA